MDLENQVKESPLEKAKRLKAEKEAKDQAKAEDEANKQAESQAKAEKLAVLNDSKQGLENKLEEVNAKIEASRGEAHETRDTMKEGGLDKDEDFKEEYDSTISEVAGNLNELRNERNNIKAELEQINLDIENFEVNEVVAEGQEAVQGEIENINQENEEAVAQIEDYPGAEAGDVKEAKEIAEEANKEVADVAEEVESGVEEVVAEKVEGAEEKKEIEELKSQVENSNMDFESFSGLTNIQNPENQKKVDEYRDDLYKKFSAIDKENYTKVKKLYDEASDEELLKLYDESFPNGAEKFGQPKHSQDQKVQYYRNLSENLENRKFISREGLRAAKLFELKNKGDSSFREEFTKLYHEQSALQSNDKKVDSIQKEGASGFNEKTELENLSKELDSGKSMIDFQDKILQKIYDYSKKHLETFDKLFYTPMEVPDSKNDFFEFIASQPKNGFIGKLGEIYKKAKEKEKKREF